MHLMKKRMSHALYYQETHSQEEPYMFYVPLEDGELTVDGIITIETPTIAVSEAGISRINFL